MLKRTVSEAVATGFAVGMFQHVGEILPFCEWLLETLGEPQNVIEIGTLHGGTAAMWHTLCRGMILTLDLPSGSWGGADHNYPARYMARNADLRAQFPRIIPLTGDSHYQSMSNSVKHILGGEQADLLFIDGDHSFHGVTRDYQMYYQFVRPGGVIAFHDIDDTPMHTRDGVEVHKFFEEYLLHNDKRRWSVRGPWGGIGAIVKP